VAVTTTPGFSVTTNLDTALRISGCEDRIRKLEEDKLLIKEKIAMRVSQNPGLSKVLERPWFFLKPL
jgi:hypothetical protein